MNKTLLLLFYIFFFLNSFAQNLKNDILEVGSINGKVKSVTLLSYKAIKNKSGDVVKGTPNSKTVLRYDINGLTTDFKRYYLNSKNQWAINTNIKYVLNNKQLQRFYYDSKNQLNKGSTNTYLLDDRYNIVEEKSFGNGKLIDRNLYEYDDKNNLIGSTNFYEGNKIHHNTINNYNSNGTLTESRDYQYNSLVNKYKYRYNTRGSLIEKMGYTITGAPNEKTIYLYDTNNHLIEETITSAYDSELNYIKYAVFDKYGNWGKRISTWRGKLSTIEERLTEYY